MGDLGRQELCYTELRGAGSEPVKEHTLHWMLGKEDRELGERWAAGVTQKRLLFGTETLAGQWNKTWASQEILFKRLSI